MEPMEKLLIDAAVAYYEASVKFANGGFASLNEAREIRNTADSAHGALFKAAARVSSARKLAAQLSK